MPPRPCRALPSLHGVKSFEALRSRAARVTFGGHSLWVADLRDIIRSKKALGRPKDLAVLRVLEKTLDEKEKRPKGGVARPEKGK